MGALIAVVAVVSVRVSRHRSDRTYDVPEVRLRLTLIFETCTSFKPFTVLYLNFNAFFSHLLCVVWPSERRFIFCPLRLHKIVFNIVLFNAHVLNKRTFLILRSSFFMNRVVQQLVEPAAVTDTTSLLLESTHLTPSKLVCVAPA